MKIEKRYLDSDFSKDSKPDEVFDSLDSLKNFYLGRGESEDWVDGFISLLDEKGEASDRFAHYKVVYENGDVVTVLPGIFSV